MQLTRECSGKGSGEYVYAEDDWQLDDRSIDSSIDKANVGEMLAIAESG